MSVKILKKMICAKKDYISNPTVSSCENGKYLGSIIDDSVIMCDGILKETKTTPTESTSTHFYSIIQHYIVFYYIALLIAGTIYLIKYRPTRKHLLP